MTDILSPDPARARRGPRRDAEEPRGLNMMESARERSRKPAPERPEPEAELTLTSERSTRAGDLPSSLRSRYFSEASKLGRGVSFFEGPGAKRPAFHDHGARLLTDQAHPAIARDMALIAAHRGWSHVRVRGEDEFRRQAWLEARSLGLEVVGYRPRDRDQQELQQRLAAERAKAVAREERRATRSHPSQEARRAPTRNERAAEGVIIETGVAPYRRRDGGRATPFVRLDRGAEPTLEVWGAGLADALARSGAGTGDRVVIRCDGVERVARERASDRATMPSTARGDDDGVLFAGYDAERFRRASPAQAARDPDLKGAQSHLAVLDAVIDKLVRDPERRTRLHAEAREIVADELAQGRRFPPARVRDVEPVLAKDVAEAFRREHEPERARAR